MKSTETGHKAERAAKVYLEMRGYQILEQNWRRPAAEIDLIACKDNIIYFVEVKYRRTLDQGGGLEAITPSKLKHMQRAAYLWVAEEKWRGDFSLAVVELAGPTFAVTAFIDNAY
ncbi:MAG TPA: YraN family protein [Candidatus Saccharimonadales bacterium]|nr:YraN family protein [Candidatus Saccharimonadales bacterium]